VFVPEPEAVQLEKVRMKRKGGARITRKARGAQEDPMGVGLEPSTCFRS